MDVYTGSDRVTSDVDSDFGIATFTLKEVTRADAGNYNIVVKNSQVLTMQEF